MVVREISRHVPRLTGEYPVVRLTRPRQSAKTMLIRDVFKDKIYINLELLDQREFVRSAPRDFLRKLPGGAVPDEIQRAPELLSCTQGLVDERQVNGRFIPAQQIFPSEIKAGETVAPDFVNGVKILEKTIARWPVRGFCRGSRRDTPEYHADECDWIAGVAPKNRMRFY
jgi:hypothetical protein